MSVAVPTTTWLPGVGARIQDLPPKGAAAQLIVTLRDRRTKRHLPRAAVRVRIPRGDLQVPPLPLVETWGAYMHYAANVPFPFRGSEFQIKVDVEPPAYDRHADSLDRWIAPAQVTFLLRRAEGRVRVIGDKPQPTEAGVSIGEDVVAARRGAQTTVDAGEYTVGISLLDPEPIWRWREGKPTPAATPEGADRHVDVVVLDRRSGRMVTGAKVTLTLRASAEQGDPISLPLRPLLGRFFHYGATVAWPGRHGRVDLKIDRPTFATTDGQRFARAQSFTLPQASSGAP